MARIDVQVSVRGDKHLVRALAQVRTSVQRKILRGAVRSAVSLLGKKTKRSLSQDTIEKRAVKKGIQNKVLVYRNSGVVWGGVGVGLFRKAVNVRTDAGKKRSIPSRTVQRMAHDIQTGNPERRVLPEPFMRSAHRAATPEMIALITKKIKIGLDTEAKRQLAKAAKV